ncbi:tRNA wybutosine-synthesizing protein 5-like [Tropilaelaps mercedesae]|uniref:tRNA wybutosine-synthesizing protein 5-like n=1 Tax=Tropilaelaps mercedesae TaxID=418985 RepID=A0A1V9X5Y1_9ACAR|nr:tRNA wybutosine-synthesizing protein 5-like [Tropilaelaps mercedesae]
MSVDNGSAGGEDDTTAPANADTTLKPRTAHEVPCYEGTDREIFYTVIYKKREPALLRNVPLGPCSYKWNSRYLSNSVGSKSVNILVSSHARFDFINKNFLNRTLPFNELVPTVYFFSFKRIQIKRCSGMGKHTGDHFLSEREFYQLRSPDDRRDDFFKTHKGLQDDFKMPNFIPKEKLISTSLKVNSPDVITWTQYDVMDTVLCQVQGTRRVVLFPPRDSAKLYLQGDKSLVLDVDQPDLIKFPLFASAQRWECTLSQPGDVLFIPALWFHGSVCKDFGVAVSCLWRHLDRDHYDRKDPLHHKNPMAAARGMDLLAKALKQLEVLPDDYRHFYYRMMINKIKEKLPDNT